MYRDVWGRELLDADEPLIAHGCSTAVGFDSAVAAGIAERYPEVRTKCLLAVSREELLVGTAQLCPVPYRFVVNLGTHVLPGSPTTPWAIYLGFANLAVRMRSLGLDRVAIAGTGCGIGTLPWPQVQQAVRRAFADAELTAQVAVYHADVPASGLRSDLDGVRDQEGVA